MKPLLKLLVTFLITVLLPNRAWCDGPPKNFKLQSDQTYNAPDHSFCIKQYSVEKDGWDFHQAGIFPSNKLDPPTRLLNHTCYGGYFDLSPDAQWLLQTQKVGSGSSDIYLYRRSSHTRFTSTTGDTFLGRDVWEFFSKQPGITTEQIPTFHKTIDLVEWRDDRYMVLKLFGLHFLDTDYSMKRWITDDWLCAYDLKKMEFVLLSDLKEKNLKKIYLLQKEG